MKTKVCCHCNRELPETTLYFHQSMKRGKLQFRGRCIICERKSRRKSYYANRKPSSRRVSPIHIDEVRDILRAIRMRFRFHVIQNIYIRKALDTTEKQLDREEFELARQHVHGTERQCRKCGSVYPLTLDYWNKDKRGEYGYMTICRQCRNATKAAWREANPDKVKAQKQRSHIRNKERNNRRSMDWQLIKSNEVYPRIALHVRKRRALAMQTTGSHTNEQIAQMLIDQNHQCFYCGKDISKKMHIDHFIPLSRGGSDDISNIVLACPHCNLSKNDKLPSEFMPDRFS